MGQFMMFTAISPLTFVIKEILFNALAYPFITVMRRMEVQSNRIGMVPKR
jgi:hypothetical protein